MDQPVQTAETDLKLDGEACSRFFEVNRLPPKGPHASLRQWWDARDWDWRQESGWDYQRLQEGLSSFLKAANNPGTVSSVNSLEVLAGRDKQGSPERFNLRFVPGEVICLVGPTGAGKSRFLADIECMAQGDTPSGRRILINGSAPETASRFTGEGRIVAQITQNMNFVMDLSVGDFLALHAESRGMDRADPAVAAVLGAAISMAGEAFGAETPLTQLSGGQSRALMIADAAFLSPKSVMLLDEIENAGIDRSQALRLFTNQGKIVLLSTHDPLLALSGTRRLVIKNGAVQDVLEASDSERSSLVRLSELDALFSGLRAAIRRGERVTLPH